MKKKSFIEKLKYSTLGRGKNNSFAKQNENTSPALLKLASSLRIAPSPKLGEGRGEVKKKAAFTLAETLITLGIIGVVAALTLPTLISNHQKKVLVTQLKKEYSTWSQAFQSLLADEGVDKLSDTSVWAKISGDGIGSMVGGGYSSLNNNGRNFVTALQKYIKFEITSYSEKNEYNGAIQPEHIFIKMLDGAIMRHWSFYSTSTISRTPEQIEAIKALDGTMFSFVGSLAIDVNGYKGPNIVGRDIFDFGISDDGRLYPMYGKDYAFYLSQIPLENNTNYWKNHSTGCETETIGQSRNDTGCAARIMENGWVMDY